MCSLYGSEIFLVKLLFIYVDYIEVNKDIFYTEIAMP